MRKACLPFITSDDADVFLCFLCPPVPIASSSSCPSFQVGLFLLMTLYMFWKAPTVEGVLDGSMDPTGVVLKPRVVEVLLLLLLYTAVSKQSVDHRCLFEWGLLSLSCVAGAVRPFFLSIFETCSCGDVKY